jgi:hypothetical protein
MQEPLPRLAKGRHKAAGHEACVMELVSFLNEEEWSDHPRCVQPVLAAAARAVNDRVTDAGRQRLVDLAPRLAGTSGADWLAGARIVLLCTEAALNEASVPAATAPPGQAAPRAPDRPAAPRMPPEVWQELTAARRTARYLLARSPAAGRAGDRRADDRDAWPRSAGDRRAGDRAAAGRRGAGRVRCPWQVRATIWLLDRVGLLKRVYPYDAALQAAFAIAQISSVPEAERRLLALLDACIDACIDA